MMSNIEKKYALILASRSPRRIELLRWSGLKFRVEPADIQETSCFTEPSLVAEDVAQKKGRAVMEKYDGLDNKIETAAAENASPLILAFDTIVTLGDRIFGKPNSVQDAREMLLALSGRVHNVVTGVYICCKKTKNNGIGPFGPSLTERTFHVQTEVEFTNITDDILDNYLGLGDSLDKAGAYGIQGGAQTFISKISGSYSNVVGLPLVELIVELKTILGCPNGNDGRWREFFIANCTI